MSLSNFLSQGGYALYVWGSYLITFAVLAIEVFVIVRCNKSLNNRVKESVVQKRSPETVSTTTVA